VPERQGEKKGACFAAESAFAGMRPALKTKTRLKRRYARPPFATDTHAVVVRHDAVRRRPATCRPPELPVPAQECPTRHRNMSYRAVRQPSYSALRNKDRQRHGHKPAATGFITPPFRPAAKSRPSSAHVANASH